MSCNSAINVSLSETCEASPDIAAFLADDTYSIHTIVEVDRVAPLGNGPWTPAVFGPPDAGNTYRFRVRDTLDGASCTGQITLQDQTPPVLNCAEDVTVSAYFKSTWLPGFLQDTLGFSNVFSIGHDACLGPVSLTYKDSLQTFPCDAPFQRIVVRTWKAVDESENFSTCKQRILIKNLTFDQIFFPADTAAVCSNANGTSPDVTGKPYVVANGHAFPANAGWGGITTGYSDSLSSECNASIYRKWIAIEWCTFTVTEHIQTINVSDAGPTSLNCPDNIAMNIFADECVGSIQLPDFQVIQSCSGIVSAQVVWENNGTIDTMALTTWNNVLGTEPQQSVVPNIFSGFPVGASTVRYEVTDACGNSASCSFTVIATDTSGLCAASDIVCHVRTVTSLPVGNVSVQLSTPSLPTVTEVTDATGTATFNSLPTGTGFDISLYRNNQVLNGVSTYDLILITRHILGLQALDSPYKLIAADASRNGVISVFDISTIRSVILGVTKEYPNNTSWRFLPTDYTFADPANPFADTFPQSTSYTVPINGPLEFTGIKIGDVDNSVIPLQDPGAEERRSRTLFFETQDRKVKAGEEWTADFYCEQSTEGFQFTLHADDLEMLEILPGTGPDKEKFALFPDGNMLTVANETSGTARFSLRLRSLRAGELKDMVDISSVVTPAEAYLNTETGALEKVGVALRFSGSDAGFQVYQNRPNPAAGFTDIGFYLPTDSEATVSVFDATGRLFFSKSGIYRKGVQSERIDLSQATPGVLYYQVRTAEHCVVRKMLRM